MKLEKLSDTQIRCNLSKEDLSQRQLHLSELAYGSEKAKELVEKAGGTVELVEIKSYSSVAGNNENNKEKK